jgi:hypothetical protein
MKRAMEGPVTDAPHASAGTTRGREKTPVTGSTRAYNREALCCMPLLLTKFKCIAWDDKLAFTLEDDMSELEQLGMATTCYANILANPEAATKPWDSIPCPEPTNTPHQCSYCDHSYEEYGLFHCYMIHKVQTSPSVQEYFCNICLWPVGATAKDNIRKPMLSILPVAVCCGCKRLTTGTLMFYTTVQDGAYTSIAHVMIDKSLLVACTTCLCSKGVTLYDLLSIPSPPCAVEMRDDKSDHDFGFLYQLLTLVSLFPEGYICQTCIA